MNKRIWITLGLMVGVLGYVVSEMPILRICGTELWQQRCYAPDGYDLKVTDPENQSSESPYWSITFEDGSSCTSDNVDDCNDLTISWYLERDDYVLEYQAYPGLLGDPWECVAPPDDPYSDRCWVEQVRD